MWEWNETAHDGINNTAGESLKWRGGAWNSSSSVLDASSSGYNNPPTGGGSATGFRVAMVPEPSALSLLAVGLGGLAMMRRRRS